MTREHSTRFVVSTVPETAWNEEVTDRIGDSLRHWCASIFGHNLVQRKRRFHLDLLNLILNSLPESSSELELK